METQLAKEANLCERNITVQARTNTWIASSTRKEKSRSKSNSEQGFSTAAGARQAVGFFAICLKCGAYRRREGGEGGSLRLQVDEHPTSTNVHRFKLSVPYSRANTGVKGSGVDTIKTIEPKITRMHCALQEVTVSSYASASASLVALATQCAPGFSSLSRSFCR